MVTYSVSTSSDDIRLACFRMLVEKPLTGQIVIVPYMKDANSDILFTMKCIENNFCTGVFRERLHLQTTFKLDNVRKTEVTADSTI